MNTRFTKRTQNVSEADRFVVILQNKANRQVQPVVPDSDRDPVLRNEAKTTNALRCLLNPFCTNEPNSKTNQLSITSNIKIAYDDHPTNKAPKKRSHFVPIFGKISVICDPIGAECVQIKPKIERSAIPNSLRDCVGKRNEAKSDCPDHEKRNEAKLLH